MAMEHPKLPITLFPTAKNNDICSVYCSYIKLRKEERNQEVKLSQNTERKTERKVVNLFD